jgi:diguanylate cyclase (GGDEF)-like protein
VPTTPEAMATDLVTSAATPAPHRVAPFSAVLLALVALHAAGVIGPIAVPIVILGGVALGVFCMHRYRPKPAWAWWLMISTGLLWTIAGLAREMTGATRDLSTGRSLLPDLFALPGYLVFGWALYGLVRSGNHVRQRDIGLDALMVVVGAALLVNELLVVPTLEASNTWVVARLAIVVYPALSLAWLMLAARIAFDSGRPAASRLLVAGCASLTIGDVVYAAGEVGLIDVSEAVLVAPYLLVPVFISASMLPRPPRAVRAGGGRVAAHLPPLRQTLVCLAMLAPALILVSDASAAQLPSIALCVALAGLAMWRVATAMWAQTASERQLVHQATHDELTGLPGRKLLTNRIDAVLSAGALPVAVMFIDLDRFKLVNDSMGHIAGDELLVLAAERLRSALPERAWVSRVSGDEFLVLATGLTEADALLLGEHLRTILAHEFVLASGVEVFVSASVGVAYAAPGGGTDSAMLVREADAAMYQSKDLGRDSVTLFDRSMRERIERRVGLERDLRQTITDGALGVAFQPIVTWPEQRMVGLEVLARWSRNGEPISPAEFIDIAEESGLIVPLGEFVLDEALRYLAWMRANVPGAANLYMSVNLSPRQLQQSDIVDMVVEALDRHQLPGHALYLELTETVMMGDQIAATAAMAGLCAAGVRLALDDFGTGFSSLSYLKRFPFDVVKIDRSFVSGLGHGVSDDSLVGAIQGMATALRLTTIAEGVETHEQARRLANLGCTYMQGHLFSTPVPADQVTELVAQFLRVDDAAYRRRCAVGPAGEATPARRSRRR